jgi:predicted TIM-barrel fold metal-dependent hydrolase
MNDDKSNFTGTTRRDFLETIAITGAAALAGGALTNTPLLAQTQKPPTKADSKVPPPAGQRIEVHHHYVPPAYVTEVHPKRALPPPVHDWTPQKTLEDLEQAGTTSAILSVTTPGVWFGDKADAHRLARLCNEYAARMVADAPRGRFGMWVAVPLPDVEGSLREIEYGMDVLKADGVGFFTSYESKYLGEPMYAPVLQELNRRKAVLYTHPTGHGRRHGGDDGIDDGR